MKKLILIMLLFPAILVICSTARSDTLSQEQIDILAQEVDIAVSESPDLDYNEVFYSSKFVLEHSANKGWLGAIGREFGRAIIGAAVSESARAIHDHMRDHKEKERERRDKPAERPAPSTHYHGDPAPAPCPAPN